MEKEVIDCWTLTMIQFNRSIGIITRYSYYNCIFFSFSHSRRLKYVRARVDRNAPA
ncbi:hypothetical protein Bpfe_014968, partial [Biomphalaria pfeifferi]